MTSGTEPVAGTRPGGTGADCDPLDPSHAVRLVMRVPAWIASLWRETITHIRWQVGTRLGAGGCFDLALAEAQGGLPVRDGEAPPVPDAGTSGQVHHGKSTPCRTCGLVEEELRRAALAREDWNDSFAPDPKSLDAEVRSLVTAAQRHEWDLARRVRAAATTRSFRTRGHRTLEIWARETLGLSARRVYQLLSLERTLSSLPRLREAFCAGGITLRKALLVGSVARRRTEAAWLERATAVTLRRLEAEVSYWRHLKDVRPAVWERLHGMPLPAGIVLVPGHPPRLHDSARVAEGEEAWPAVDRVRSDGKNADLHDSARRGSVDPASQVPGERAPLTAREFLAALEADEALDPLPERMCTISMWVFPEVLEAWNARCSAVRARQDASEPVLEDWEIFSLVLYDYWKTYDTKESRARRRRQPILERDGWQCLAPGCTSIGSGALQAHHFIFRSAGGSVSDPANQGALCNAHHLDQLHQGRVRCRGRAPDHLTWELGVTPGEAAFLIYRDEIRIGGTAE